MLYLCIELITILIPIDHRRRKEVPFGGGKVLLFAREACANFYDHAHFFEVQRSLVAIEGSTAVSSKEMVENVHNCRFLRLF